MTTSLPLEQRLRHIVDAIRKITLYVEGFDESDFLQDRMIQDAVMCNIRVIGEACSQIQIDYPNFVIEHPEVPWSDAVGKSNALAHEFFSVDYELVWKTLCNDLPNLRVNIMQILQSTSFN
jgi:uncharacterized protein with HEPN domain